MLAAVEADQSDHYPETNDAVAARCDPDNQKEESHPQTDLGVRITQLFHWGEDTEEPFG